jgi:outer membrane protein OmpA-like peptidoglycan-associated protein
MAMRPLTLAAGLCLAASVVLGGCASSRTGISLLPGEVGEQGEVAPTGAVVVLDPSNDQDIQVIDQANSQSGVKGDKVSVKQLAPGQLDAQYGDLLALLPPKPSLFRLYFKQGSTDLADPSVIEEVLVEIGKRKGADVQIVGHTDTTGDGTLNDSVSAKRADAIKLLLAGRGIDADIIRTSGRGERELRVPTDDNVDNAENRRVEITVR